ncbi:MAG: sigma-70 family RNA polymerase sigma factor [Gemmataceae bacterium]
MPLTQVDRALIQRCLQHHRGAWNDFVDRFLGLIYHVIHFTAHQRSVPLQPEDVEDLAAEVLLQIVANNYAVLNQFRGQSSLATYLTVIARRICVQELTRRAAQHDAQAKAREKAAHPARGGIGGLETLEEVQRLLRRLPGRERDVVRMFYLEGRTYEEISTALNLPVNTIGPVLSRAKKKLKAAENGAAKKGG